MTSTSLWCAVDTVQSPTSHRRSWVQWWPLTSDLVWWTKGTPSASKYWHQSHPCWLPPPLKTQAPNCRTCHRRHSPHMSPSSRRHLGAINPRALIRPAALLPPQPHSPRHQPTSLSLQATAWRSVAAAAQELRGIPKVQREGTAVHQLWLSASNKNPRSWIRCIWMMVCENFFISLNGELCISKCLASCVYSYVGRWVGGKVGR